MTRRILLTAAVVISCFLGLSPAIAQYEQYKLVYTLRSETGRQFEFPYIAYAEYYDCLRAKKKVKVGGVIPRGVLISADLKTYAATILGIRCVGSDRKN